MKNWIKQNLNATRKEVIKVKKLELKFDVGKLTKQFNKINKIAISTLEGIYIYTDFTNEQMSEMIQKKAFELGYTWKPCGKAVKYNNAPYLFIYSNNVIRADWGEKQFKQHKNEKANLLFFNIEPEPKTVTFEVTPEQEKSIREYLK